MYILNILKLTLFLYLKTSPMLENISSLNEGISTLPHRKSVFKQSTKKADSLNNRKSMTPAEGSFNDNFI